MPKIGPVSPKKLVAILKREGFRVARQKGSHLILMKESVRTVIPVHPGRDVKPGLVRAIIREAEITRKRFFELLKEV